MSQTLNYHVEKINCYRHNISQSTFAKCLINIQRLSYANYKWLVKL